MNPETLAFFRNASGDDAAFARELISVFCTETGELITEIYQAVPTGDIKQLARATHKMKGSCAALGADALVRTCAQLEEQIAVGESPELVALVRQLRADRQRVIDVLEAASGETKT